MWTKSEQETFSIAGTTPDGSQSVDIVTYRFQSRRNIDTQITPLITPAIARLEEDMATNVNTSIYLSAESSLLTLNTEPERRAYHGCVNGKFLR
jgi:hypothetical protein